MSKPMPTIVATARPLSGAWACGVGLLAVSLALFSTRASADWAIPEELQDEASVLDEAQSAFITSGAALEFIPERQLEHELATRSAEELKQLVDDLMALAEQMAYDPERDMGAIPLNLTSRDFNMPQPTPSPLRDFDREPGPFSVHRYLAPRSGVPTFGGAKVAIYADDLVAGKVDVAIIGVPSNFGSGRRDAARAPDAMRALNTIDAPDAQSLVRPMEALSAVDYGTFATDRLSTERSVGHVTAMVAETAATGAIPMLVGGDTSMLYPGVKGVAQSRGDRSFGLLHFSAHPDAERDSDHTMSDQQALFGLLEEGIVAGNDTIPVGLRGPAVDVDTLRWLRDQEARYHTMAEVQQRGFEAVLKEVLSEVEQGPGSFFVSIDVSVIDPAELVGSGRIAANGLRVQQVTRAIREVCASKDIVGFEITDMVPTLDLSRLSVVNANALLNACLVGIAVKRSGLDADYVHPLVLSHGQR
jgi:agmatinase